MHRLPHRLRDAGLAVAVAAMLVSAGWPGRTGRLLPDLLGCAFLVVGGLALAARRRHPVAVLALTGVGVVGYQMAGFAVPPVALLVGVYTATRYGRRRAALLVVAAVLAVQPLLALLSHTDTPVEAGAAHVAIVLGWIAASGAAGEAVWQAERRAEEAERTREEMAHRHADEERLRIARELHDSLTHQISVIKVQAGVAVHLARKRGEQVPEALLVIQDAGREAARELRATLGALRGGVTPAYGLDHLPVLVERMTATGVPTTLTVDGQRPELPVTVDRAAYRIVQEALTNVARHAGPARASVHVSHGRDLLTVRVDDDGTGVVPTRHVPGLGLVGMRERVTALGGRLRAEARSGGGGFTVEAVLPVGEPS